METNRKKSKSQQDTTFNSPEHQQQQQKKKGSEKSKKRKEKESNYPEPVFWIGGKTDPDRFSTPTETEKPFFFRIGFHDDERSDTASPIPFNNRDRDFYYSDRSAFFDAQRRILMERIGVSASTSDILKVPRPIPMMPSNSASSLRTTLSPVREVASNTHFETIEHSAKKLCAHDCSHSSSIVRVCYLYKLYYVK
jgi:hypothetical protein